MTKQPGRKTAVRPSWPVVLLLTTAVVPLAAGLFRVGRGAGSQTAVGPLGIAVVFVVYAIVLGGGLLLARLARRSWPLLQPRLEAHTRALENLPERRIGWWILLASGAGLFVELLLIRWHSNTFLVFSFYKNLTLLAAFLGLGIGYSLGSRRPVWTPWVLPALCLQLASLQLVGRGPLRSILQNPVTEQPTMGLETLSDVGHAAVTYGFLLLVFSATVLTCVPLGHLASFLMQRRPPLVAYGWNLLGSLVGIGLLTLLSQAWSPPAVWLAVAVSLVVPFLALPGQRSLASIGTALVCLGVTLVVLLAPTQVGTIELYSPYQPINIRVAGDGALQLSTTSWHQEMIDLRPHMRRAYPSRETTASYYEFPYTLRPHPGRVLVVGAGTGNDVAAGLRMGARHVDAVEIDPAILAAGRALHPERPYAHPRVSIINNDARNFLRSTDESYELIVYGLLDSHTALSSLSNVRLDSFVYTVEGVRDARRRLADDGVLVMTFALLSDAQAQKFYEMIEQAFDGRVPHVFKSEYVEALTFVACPSGCELPEDLSLSEITDEFRDRASTVDLSTDDWPFVYMPVRRFPRSYVALLAIVALASALLLYQLMPRGEGGLSTTCFLLGAGFMLIETKGITELALAFGNTWTVVSAVIAAILVMAFLANLAVYRGLVPPISVTYSLLIGSVLLGMVASHSLPAGAIGAWLTAGLITLPVFFSGFAFSTEIQRTHSIPTALSSNLLGAMLGGILEYNAMQFGYKSLYLLAAAIYALAFLSALRRTAR